MNVYTDNHRPAEPYDWRDDAACLEVDPEMFFGEDGIFRGDALRLCRNVCTVTADCLTYALGAREEFGIWGGTSEVERRRMLKGRTA